MHFKFVLNVKLIFFMCLISIIFGNKFVSKLEDRDNDTFLVVGGYRPRDIRQLAKYVVSLRLKYDEKKMFGAGHFCGGSIISDKAILTAAHCCFDPKTGRKFRYNRLLVVAGTPERIAKSKDTQILKASKIIVHKKYRLERFENDIAIIKLKDSITISPSTEIAGIANAAPTAQLPVTVVGWGRIFENGPIPNEIIYADLILWEEQKCSGSKYFISELMICAISTQMQGTGSCQGDSGGPLFSDFKVFGIVSFGMGCARLLSPGYYTNVYHYSKWIQENSVGLPMAGYVLIILMIIVQYGCLSLF